MHPKQKGAYRTSQYHSGEEEEEDEEADEEADQVVRRAE